MNIAISRKALLRELMKYGFVEVSDVIAFLEVICPTVPDDAAVLYMKEKLSDCLKNNDNGSEYFDELRTVVKKLEEEHQCSKHNLKRFI